MTNKSMSGEPCTFHDEKVQGFDSRERLEVDLKTHLYEFGGYCFSSREGHTDNVDTFFDDFVSLLDRQASITRLECAEEHRTRLSELHDLLDEAASERELLRAELTEYKHSHPDAPNQPISQYDARKTAETPETDTSKCDIRDFDDSREKLLEDANALAIDYWDRKRTWGEANDLKREVIALLDRQAAITERELQVKVDSSIAKRDEWKTKCETYEVAYKQADAERKRYSEQIDELFAERDELKAWFESEHVDELHDAAHGSERVTKTGEMSLDRPTRENMQLARDLGECMAERDELTNAVNELQKKQPYCYNPEQPLDTLNTIGRYIDELRAERDGYREKLGRAVDSAWEIVQLMDEGAA